MGLLNIIKMLIIFPSATETSKSHKCGYISFIILVISKRIVVFPLLLLLFLPSILFIFLLLRTGRLNPCFQIIFLLFRLLFDLFLVQAEPFPDLIQGTPFNLHRHSQIPLMFLPVYVIQEIDRVFDHTIAHITIISTRLRGRSGFTDDDTFAELAVQINFELAALEWLPGDRLLWKGQGGSKSNADSILRSLTILVSILVFVNSI